MSITKHPTIKGQLYTLRNGDGTVYEVSQFVIPNGDIIGDNINNEPNHHSILIRNTVGGFSMVEDSILVK